MASSAPPNPARTSLEDKILTTRTPDEETEDGRIRNREAATKIRDAWIYKQIRARQDEFTQYRSVEYPKIANQNSMEIYEYSTNILYPYVSCIMLYPIFFLLMSGTYLYGDVECKRERERRILR